MTLDAAYRYAAYSHAGIARAWKLGGLYVLVKDLSFRGTYSRAVRAPNITEAFLPATAAFFDYTDPCDDAEILDDPDRAANCAALGVPPGFDAQDNIGVPISASGNAELDPETARDLGTGPCHPAEMGGESVGHVRLLQHRDRSRDLLLHRSGRRSWTIASTHRAGLILHFAHCRRGIQRHPMRRSIESTFVNASALATKGLDIQVAYTFEMEDVLGEVDPFFAELGGRIALTVIANYVEELRFFAFQSVPDRREYRRRRSRRSGMVADHERDVRQWAGPFHLAQQVRGRGVAFCTRRWERGEDIFLPPVIEAVWYHDFIATYRLENLTGYESEVYLGVNNAFNEELPLGLTGNGTSSRVSTCPGRTVFLGVRAKL